MRENKRLWIQFLALGVAGSMAASAPMYAMGGIAGISAVRAGQSTAVQPETEAAVEAAGSAYYGGIAAVQNTAAEPETEAAVETAGTPYYSGIAAVQNPAVQEETEEEAPEQEEEAPARTVESEPEPEPEPERQETWDSEPEYEPSPYENVAIAQVRSSVRVREEATTESSMVGRIPNNGAGTILKTVEREDGRWYKIRSGSVEGYVKADYFVTGEEAEDIAEEVGTVKATVTARALRMHSDADIDSSVVDLLGEDETYVVLSQSNGYAKLKAGDKVGYVDDLYVDYTVEFEKAVSIEEERAAEREEEARKKAAAEAAREEEEAVSYYDDDDDDMVVYDDEEAVPYYDDDDDDVTYYDDDDDDDVTYYDDDDEEAVTYYDDDDDDDVSYDDDDDDDDASYDDDDDDASYDDDDDDEPVVTFDDDDDDDDDDDEAVVRYADEAAEDMDDEPVEQVNGGSYNSDRDEIVDYALSFVGEVPYVYGGNSLSSGVDCSGFVQQIFRHFGVSLPRDSDSQAGAGYGVKSSDKQPGDIICYNGHVGIYIGDGEVVHASNEESGVRVSSWNYRSVVSIRNVLD